MTPEKLKEFAQILGTKDEADLFEKLAQIKKRWSTRLSQEDAKHKDFRSQAETVYERYLQEEEYKGKFNVLWANAQIMQSALYSATPKADVRRRQTANMDSKPIAIAIERALNYGVDTTDFDGEMDRAVESFIVCGLGVVRVKYSAEVSEMPDFGEMVVAQSCELDAIPYCDFRWEPVGKWKHVGWVAFVSHKSQKEIEREFGVRLSGKAAVDADDDSRYDVFEIWDKDSNMVYVICKEHQYPLDLWPDRLKLKSFFPCPKPMFTNLNPKKLIPTPDYLLYEKQAKQLDRLVSRAEILVNSIKGGGFYDGSLTEFGQMSTAEDTEWVPITGLAERLRATDGNVDFSKMVAEWPIQQKIQALAEIRKEIEANKQEMYEILGIADIVRGSTKATETLGAQQLKGQFANLRMVRKQNVVNGFVREIFRLKAEIIAEHYTPDILTAMTGIQIDEQAKAIMQSDLMRSFAIDVETDSTVARDDQEEKQARMDMIETVTGYLERIQPAVNQGAIPAELGKQLLMTAVQSFKHGRNLEEAVDQMPDQMQQLQQISQERDELAQRLEQAEAMLAQLNEREEGREDIKVQAQAAEDTANAEKDLAEAARIRAETMGQQLYPVV